MIRPYIEVIHETQKAMLIKFDMGDCWIPKAMIIDMGPELVEVYANFRFSYLPKEDDVADMFGEIEPEPVVKKVKKAIKKIKKKFEKNEHKIINPDNLDLDIYYTDGSRRDELPF